MPPCKPAAALVIALGLTSLASIGLVAARASAQTAPTASPTATATAAKPSSPPLPTGTPPTVPIPKPTTPAGHAPGAASGAGQAPSAPLPAGHPAGGATAPPDEAGPADGDPHGRGGPSGSGGSGSIPGLFEGAPDSVDEDSTLPPGTIAVEIVDSENKPIPRIELTVSILHNSVAKGESRERRARTTDDAGKLVESGLETGSGIAYRITIARDGALFATSPFSLTRERGVRAVLHVFPVARDVAPLDKLASLPSGSMRDKALVIVEGALFAELKEDRIQFQQMFRIVNAGATAWVPRDLVLALPPGFTALTNGTQEMTDTGIDPEPKGPKLRGTFGPGKHEINFRWQLPYDDEKDVELQVALPPNVVSMRVLAAASQEMRLTAEGFPPAEPQSDGQGQRMLVTQKQVRRGEALITSVKVALRDIPVPGPERRIATALAAISVLFGLIWAANNKRPADTAMETKSRRALLLADLEELERARRSGDIGPKTYERARRDLIDAIARTLKKSDPVPT